MLHLARNCRLDPIRWCNGGALFRHYSNNGAIARRLAHWDSLAANITPLKIERPIEIRLKSGHIFKPFDKPVTPASLIKAASEHDANARKAIVAKFNSVLWDLSRPITQNGSLEFLTFEDEEGKDVFWHSSAHVLGQALESIYGDDLYLCDGPPIKQGGFFYEFFLKSQTVSENSLANISPLLQEILKQNQPFLHLSVSRDQARDIFKDNKYKLHYIDRVPDNQEVTLYRCGNLVDLCRGPHLQSTGMIKAIELTKVSGAYWLGQSENDLLQRVYGISFPSTADLKKWQTDQEEALKRDHRIIGKAQKLFMTHHLSPGSVFLLPHGTIICNRLVKFLREEYQKLDYQEVQTPLIYKKDLWVQSGHWEHYKDDMFLVVNSLDTLKKLGEKKAEEKKGGDDHDHSHQCQHEDDFGDVMGLKPMNCPGHCLIFDSAQRSYRDLPLRLADFSPLHRNEISGALSGLTRVRKFHQDDAHIFCTQEQVEAEVASCLKLIDDVYSKFGFQNYSLTLSTQPKKFMGIQADWDMAQQSLISALNKLNRKWTINEGDGAFYGPKIDVIVNDALGRKHQTATIQLDFQLPQRFKLEYKAQDGKLKTPIIIHRAVLGSVERFFGIIIEHFNGKWPFWLSPRQVCLIPVSTDFAGYAEKLCQELKTLGYSVELDLSDDTLNKKIRNAQTSSFNFIGVVGAKEVENNSVSIRERQENSQHVPKQFTIPFAEFKGLLGKLQTEFK